MMSTFILLLLQITLLACCSHAFLSKPALKLPQQQRVATEHYFFNFGGKPQQQDETNKKEEKKTVEAPITTSVGGRDDSYDDDDPVEKIFNFFFGKKEAEPLGLKRFGAERFPEQYPATITEWAAPLATDDKEMAMLRPLLKNTNLETRALQLVYNANRNGWNPTAFHKAVDKKGPSLVVCTTTSGVVCGGYNPKGWVSYGEARGSIAAFLFVFADNDEGKPTKLRKVGGASLAQIDEPESGPKFGADSLIIPLGKENPKMARSKLGSYYERFPDGNNSLFRTSGSVLLKEFKVYQGVYGPDEFIPFTDAEPFALY
jgi:TLD